MPRKKKDDFEKLLDVLDAEELTKEQLQIAQRYINRRLRRGEYGHAIKEQGPAETDGRGLLKGKGGEKDGDGDVSPPAKEDG